MEYLALRLSDDSSDGRWAALDGDGRLVRKAESGPLAHAVEAARGRRVIALVPGVEVISTTAQLPKSSAARLRKMLPYSLEETLAEDIDELFFAVGPRLDVGAVSVAVVSSARLEAWLATLAAEGLFPHAVYSDADGVPDTPATLTLVLEGERIYGRAPGQPPFVFDGLSLEQVLEAVRAAPGGTELKYAVVYVDDDARAIHEDGLEELAAEMSSVDVKLMPDGALYRLAATLAAQPGTNLLQGPYAPKSNWVALLKPWRAAAGLLVGFALLLLLGHAAEYISLRQDDQALAGVLTEQCQRNFGTPELSACEAAVRGRLGGSGADGVESFLSALSVVAESRGPESRIEALSYRNSVMDLQLVVPDIPALDAFAQKIEGSRRFDVVIQSANPGDSGVEGRVQVVGATE